MCEIKNDVEMESIVLVLCLKIKKFLWEEIPIKPYFPTKRLPAQKRC